MLLQPESLLWTVVLGLAVAFVLTQIAAYVTTVYLHRALTHRAMDLQPWFGGVFKAVLWMVTGIRTRQWVAVHRKHHAFTDQEEDPHSPAQLGWVRVQLGNLFLYRKVAKDEAVVRRYARDLPRTRADALLFDHAVLGLGVGVGLLVLLFGWKVAAIAGVAHFVGYIGMSGAINAVAHTFGKRPYDNSATNLQWLAFLSAGEGLHNNHHAAPTSARFSLHPREYDPAWPSIRLFRSLGLVTVRHDSPKFVGAGAGGEARAA